MKKKKFQVHNLNKFFLRFRTSWCFTPSKGISDRKSTKSPITNPRNLDFSTGSRTRRWEWAVLLQLKERRKRGAGRLEGRDMPKHVFDLFQPHERERQKEREVTWCWARDRPGSWGLMPLSSRLISSTARARSLARFARATTTQHKLFPFFLWSAGFIVVREVF